MLNVYHIKLYRQDIGCVQLTLGQKKGTHLTVAAILLK